MTYKSRIKCCFSLNYCQFCVYFLRWCCRVAIWPPCTFPCTRFRSPQFLSAKFLCFNFASTNHIARNHLDKTVYGPHCLQPLQPRLSQSVSLCLYPPTSVTLKITSQWVLFLRERKSVWRIPQEGLPRLPANLQVCSLRLSHTEVRLTTSY